jgi:hypothetical protein
MVLDEKRGHRCFFIERQSSHPTKRVKNSVNSGFFLSIRRPVLTTQTSWLAEVEPSRFDEFLQVFWTAVRQTAEDLEESPIEGVGELSAQPWPLSYALDKGLRFAAFRWYQPNPENPQARPLRLESFFLCPANTSPRVGLQIYSAGQSQAVVPAWWAKTLSLSSTPHLGKSFPGFMELVAILASNGNIATSSAETQAAVSDLGFELDYYRQLSEEQAEELRQLKAQLRDSWRPTEPGSDTAEDQDEPRQQVSDLSELPAWALQRSESITILPRALNGAKKSLYENPAAVYAALELLAGPYRDHRLGLLDKSAFNDALANAGVQFAGSVGPSVAGEQGAAYFVNWRGRKRFLDFHLLKGGGRDERYCLRVYFFWDDETKQAVVGWLPSHLSNSLS